MTKLEWHKPGDKRFDAGVDRGVFYSKNEERTGHAWNGLTDIVVSPEDASLEPVYIDGFVRAFDVSPGRFKATLDCFDYPDEFGVEVLGEDLVSTMPGLMATNQEIGSFDLSYRSGTGDDVNGSLSNYKIHLVYDAIAVPSEKQYTTVSDSTEPAVHSFEIEAVPQTFQGGLPTAHFIVDTRVLPKKIVSDIEQILYGDEFNDARMMDLTEVQAIIEQEVPVSATNLAPNPSFENLVDTPLVIFENLATRPFGSLPNVSNVSGFLLTAMNSPKVMVSHSGPVIIGQTTFPEGLFEIWTTDSDSPYETLFSFTGHGSAPALSGTNRDWVFSCYCMSSDLITPYSHALRIRYYNPTTGTLSHEEMHYAVESIDMDWSRLVWKIRRPTGTFVARIDFVVTSGVVRDGLQVWATGLQVTQGTTVIWDFVGGTLSMSNDYIASWMGAENNSKTSASVLSPEGIIVAPSYYLALSSEDYASDRARSLKLIPNSESINMSYVPIASQFTELSPSQLEPGTSYRVSVDYTSDEWTNFAVTDRGIVFATLAGRIMSPVQNLPGVTQRLSLDITTPPDGDPYNLLLANGEPKGGANVYFDRLMIVKLEEAQVIPSTLDYFDGETRIDNWTYGEWVGEPDVSASNLRSF